ncbi:MAG: flagellar hook-basal body protein [bacterium]
MDRGLYIGATGMLAQEIRMDVVANNLANVETPGFKKNVSIQVSFKEMLARRLNDELFNMLELPIDFDRRPVIGKLGLGAGISEVATIFDSGMIKETSAPLDVALDGPGFFTVETTKGDIRYTRNGSFTLNGDRFLVTHDGDYVLNRGGGRIQIPQRAGKVIIGDNGDIAQLLPDGSLSVLDSLQIVHFANPRWLEKVGSSFYKATENSGPPIPVGTPVIQGALEQSNVNIVQEMVAMIEVSRAYEANQKAILAHDSMLGKAVNEVTRK